ncbi:hypothetical protein [uncultured Tessaracoccus sp.]|uniref:hypothetical protein n=1 Tax=uncultured Tessaracoccus sp. TaxID=905023 RepID=UPI00260508D2|nr:hypothetical protein [uncultured Tessaracoccus sp.]
MAGGDRAEAARIRLQLAEQQARSEALEAQVLIDEFVLQAKQQGLASVPLKATTYSGHKVKTDKRGWYLRQNHSVAIDEDGGFHHLVVGGGLKERLRGVKLPGTQPTLVVGRGGRDGETGYLREFLQWVLEGKVNQAD